MFQDPLAYFLTFTVYGSWLHGDSRGSFQPNGRFVLPDANWVRFETSRINGKPFVLTPHQRQIVDHSLQEISQERHWILHARNVRTNHVHIVVTAIDIPPERVMCDFKSKATRALRKAGFFKEKDQKVWTRHGSTIYVFTENALHDVCEYVYERQNGVRFENDLTKDIHLK